MKIVILLLVLYPSTCFADVSGYLFLGKYLNHEQQDLEGRNINYRAGIYLEYKAKESILFIKEETLIGDIDNIKSYPNQINYTIGIKQKYKKLELIMKHKCLHPVDGVSGGSRATSYNSIEGRLNF